MAHLPGGEKSDIPRGDAHSATCRRLGELTVLAHLEMASRLRKRIPLASGCGACASQLVRNWTLVTQRSPISGRIGCRES